MDSGEGMQTTACFFQIVAPIRAAMLNLASLPEQINKAIDLVNALFSIRREDYL